MGFHYSTFYHNYARYSVLYQALTIHTVYAQKNTPASACDDPPCAILTFPDIYANINTMASSYEINNTPNQHTDRDPTLQQKLNELLARLTPDEQREFAFDALLKSGGNAWDPELVARLGNLVDLLTRTQQAAMLATEQTSMSPQQELPDDRPRYTTETLFAPNNKGEPGDHTVNPLGLQALHANDNAPVSLRPDYIEDHPAIIEPSADTIPEDRSHELINQLASTVQRRAIYGKFPKGLAMPYLNEAVPEYNASVDQYDDFGSYSSNHFLKEQLRNYGVLFNNVLGLNEPPFLMEISHYTPADGRSLLLYSFPTKSVDYQRRPSPRTTVALAMTSQEVQGLLGAVRNENNGPKIMDNFMHKVIGESGLQGRTPGTENQLRIMDSFEEIRGLWQERYKLKGDSTGNKRRHELDKQMGPFFRAAPLITQRDS